LGVPPSDTETPISSLLSLVLLLNTIRKRRSSSPIFSK
jgi:hypothetical protein